jgi:8-oxo-dGTP pyrophosphatase MutT (NUDIX family)
MPTFAHDVANANQLRRFLLTVSLFRLIDDRTHLQKLASRVGAIFDGQAVQQSGAICVREGKDGKEILLITSRDTGRWVIPKGTVEKDEDPRHAAAREAKEEAGVSGKVSPKPLGYYTYVKGREGVACMVSVYRLDVGKAKSDFPEAKARQLEWVSPLEAARRVDELELKGLFQRV